MEPLTPIPIPRHQKWRNFKMRGFPALVFAITLAALAVLWMNRVNPAAIVGEAEAKQVELASPASGALSQLKVARFEPVSAGETLGQIITTDPAVTDAQLSVIGAEVKLLQTQLSLDLERNALDYERLRLDWMQQKVSLATSRVQLQLAESEFSRVERLIADQIASEQELDIARTERDALRKEVEEKELLVQHTEAAMNRIHDSGPSDDPQTRNSSLLAAIEVQQERLRLTEAQMKPVPLVSPINGTVSLMRRYSGENVSRGDPILVISSSESNGIIAYIAKPFPAPLEKNMKVLIQTENRDREEAFGYISALGVQMEPIPNRLKIPGVKSDVGLPIYIATPPTLSLMPGERVRLSLQF